MNLNAKTPYMDRSFRSKELTPQIGFASKESAIAYLNEVLSDYRIQASYTPEQIQQITRLLVEIALETIRQTGDLIDYRGIGEYQQALQKSLSDQRAAFYRADVIQAWEQIKRGYNATGKVQFDLGEYLVEPLLLSPHDEKPIKGWSVEPTDNIGVVRCFDVNEEEFSRKTWAETAKNGISCGHLHAFHWDTEVYNRAPETPVYRSYRGFVEAKLTEFQQEHGALTPVVVFKSSDVMKQVYGGDLFLVGFRVTVKSLVEQSGEQKQGKLSKLISHLTNIG